jgi:hypothetical protein
LRLHILPPLDSPRQESRIALFDPRGETSGLLDSLGIRCRAVSAEADLSAFDLLIIGKAALTPEGPAPDLTRVREGLKVVVFEQTAQALEQRLGFRVQEYGLRKVFPRVPDHLCLAGIAEKHLRDWRGESTLLPRSLTYEPSEKYAGVPVVRWCGIEVPRLWRCGNRGNVASVLIEKPAIGDFLPIVDGGYNLQYSPLMEYREGKGRVLFCQLDVTGRSEEDPAARRLVANIFSYVASAEPHAERAALYVGNRRGKEHLESTGIGTTSYKGGELSPDQVLIVGRGGGTQLAEHGSSLQAWLRQGGRLLSLALDGDEANRFVPAHVQTKQEEHIAACFEPPSVHSPLAGVAPADVHNRDPRRLPLLAEGCRIVGNGVLAHQDNQIVFCQIAPYEVLDPREGPSQAENLRKTFRRSSFLVTRLLGNMGVRAPTPLLSRFATPPSGERENSIVQNGRFDRLGKDELPEHWEFSSQSEEAKCVVESGGPETLQRSLRIDHVESNTEGGSAMLAQYDVPVVEKQWYAVSFWSKAKDLQSGRVTVALQDTEKWRALFEYQRFRPSASWKKFTFFVQAASTRTSKTRFQIWYDQPGTVWLADVEIRPCSAPSEGRWTKGLYVDTPKAWDDPYRFFRW